MIKLSPGESVMMFFGALIAQSKRDFVYKRECLLAEGPWELKRNHRFLFGVGAGSLEELGREWKHLNFDVNEVRTEVLKALESRERFRVKQRRLWWSAYEKTEKRKAYLKARRLIHNTLN